jgi:hypothetical protein
MTEKITLSEDNPYGPGNFDLAAMPHKNTWTDGLPHDFRGWGPRTPDPAETRASPAPSGELVWSGGEDHHNHYVWRFDGRRHRHH